MATIPEIFRGMAGRYRPGVLTGPRSYYFSIGDYKYTVKCTPQACTVEEGKTIENADAVLKTTPEIFEKLLRGQMPGALDLARGRVKTNDPAKLADLRNLFDEP